MRATGVDHELGPRQGAADTGKGLGWPPMPWLRLPLVDRAATEGGAAGTDQLHESPRRESISEHPSRPSAPIPVPKTTLKRILLTGDVHGNTDWVLHHILPQARRHGCQLVLQLGDFGIWPGPEGQRYLGALSRQAKGARIPIWFIDGNHEDFDQLDALPLDARGRRPVRDHITHLPRGYRWEWSEPTLLACGGASSIDVADRLSGRSWWPQEAITDQDVARCSEGGRVDILFTHDIQAEVPLTDPLLEPLLPPSVADALSRNRQRLQRITEVVRPKLQVHGHWHLPYDRTIIRSSDKEQVRIVSLNSDPSFAVTADHHCAVLDLDVRALSVPHAVQVID